MSEEHRCQICGEPMPKGEEMFNYHGYSCDCPKPPLKKEKKDTCKWKLGWIDADHVYLNPHKEGFGKNKPAIEIEPFCPNCGKTIEMVD